jgi:hypothetical protein
VSSPGEFLVQKGNDRSPGNIMRVGDGRGVEVVSRLGPWTTLTGLSFLEDDHQLLVLEDDDDDDKERVVEDFDGRK